MEHKKIRRIKWQISIIALIVFCINLIPLPKTIVNAAVEVKSPVIDAVNNKVTFNYYNADAKSVSLAGEMNEWKADANPMTKDKDGIWSITIDIPEDVDQYIYKFVVDGKWISDPANTNTIDDGFGGKNTVVKFALVSKAMAPIRNADGSITFSYKDTNAKSVSIAGDLNEWSPTATPLTKNEYGVWTCTITPKEGTTQIIYKFVVDGNWIANPYSSDVVGDGFGGVNSVYYVGEAPVDNSKTVVLKYERPDGDYTGWCLWTWSTGKQDGQVDFEVKDGVAIAKFKVGEATKSVGFKIMKNNWAEIDYDSDRYINIDESMNVTKVSVTSGKGDIFAIPAIQNEAYINNNVIEFKYRNKELFATNEQVDKIASVKVDVTDPAGESFSGLDMKYDSTNEYYSYNFSGVESKAREVAGLKEGTYKYKIKVAYSDGTEEVLDEKEVVYAKKNINVSASLSDDKVNSDENTIVTLNLSGEEASANNIREMYIDLSEVGGTNKALMSKTLIKDNKLRQAIGIEAKTTAGVKNIPIVVVDVNGEEHRTSVSLTVETNISTGEALDFSFDEAVIYQIVTDRFLNGDTSNDDPHGNNYDKTAPYTYHGGDFKGITSKIGYLKDLGINTIWISPIVENSDINENAALNGGQWSYHGYWAKDFTLLDPHWGTMEDFKELIDTAHENGIKIMVDVVLNHAGYKVEKEPQFQGMIRDKDGEDIFTKASSKLPDFKTEDPVVRAKLIKWQAEWLTKCKTESGNSIDYFRVDTVKHVEDDTWKEFKTALTEIDPDFKMIGEWYGADENNDAGQLQSGQMDALLDFSYNSTATKFVNGSIKEASDKLDDRSNKVTSTNLLGQFLSSHDEDGFLAAVDGDLDNEITEEDRNKGLVATSLQLTDKGIPVIYYGEEVGLSAKNDFNAGDLNRYDMNFEAANTEVGSKTLNHYKKLLDIREKYQDIFAKGDRKTLAANNEEGYTVFSRSYNNESVVTILNITNDESQIEFDLKEDVGEKVLDEYSGTTYTVGEDGKLVVDVPAASNGGTVILTEVNDETNPPKPGSDDNGSSKNESNSKGTNSGTNNASNKGAKTSDSTNTIILIAMLFVASGCLTIVAKNRKRA